MDRKHARYRDTVRKSKCTIRTHVPCTSHGFLVRSLPRPLSWAAPTPNPPPSTSSWRALASRLGHNTQPLLTDCSMHSMSACVRITCWTVFVARVRTRTYHNITSLQRSTTVHDTRDHRQTKLRITTVVRTPSTVRTDKCTSTLYVLEYVHVRTCTNRTLITNCVQSATCK